MSYLSAVIAYFMTLAQEVTGQVWWDVYLDNLVTVETWFFRLSWVPFAIGLVLLVIMVVASLRDTEFLEGAFGCGCATVVMLFWPLFEWITLLLAQGMASSINAEGVVINQGKLIISAILYIVIGAG